MVALVSTHGTKLLVFLCFLFRFLCYVFATFLCCFILTSLSSSFLSLFTQVPQALGVRHVGRRHHVPGNHCRFVSPCSPHSLNPTLGESPIVCPSPRGGLGMAARLELETVRLTHIDGSSFLG